MFQVLHYANLIVTHTPTAWTALMHITIYSMMHTQARRNTCTHTLYQAFHQYYCLDLLEHYAPMLAPPPYYMEPQPIPAEF